LTFSGLYIVTSQKIALLVDCNVLKIIIIGMLIIIALIIQIHKMLQNSAAKFISKAVYISYLPAYVLPVHNTEKTGNH
jgi:hypothetical protein